ncbi:hypothetical protein [Lederbergia citrea]|uniref:Uncharacterized protein n=1 Tax=Lederbergia citrea TaxID=2833581 RepID=A0A942UJB2_9BACI|nr:hypothetical protein [Lederbergia citrea]MBS4221720.1 hypothetical protein [Lederbergia citrea]
MNSMLFSLAVIIANELSFFLPPIAVEQAERYVKETRGYRVPVLPPTLLEIVYNCEQEECCASENYALKTGFEGESLPVYRSDLDWENAES